MNGMDWVVLGAGFLAIAWVNWYFFLAQPTAVNTKTSVGGMQEITVTVKGGYDPGIVRVQRGKPVRMVFDRQETSSCSEEIVLPEFGIKRFLPAFQKTAVEFIPDKVGTFGFMCGMSMLHGKLVVHE